MECPILWEDALWSYLGLHFQKVVHRAPRLCFFNFNVYQHIIHLSTDRLIALQTSTFHFHRWFKNKGSYNKPLQLPAVRWMHSFAKICKSLWIFWNSSNHTNQICLSENIWILGLKHSLNNRKLLARYEDFQFFLK